MIGIPIGFTAAWVVVGLAFLRWAHKLPGTLNADLLRRAWALYWWARPSLAAVWPWVWLGNHLPRRKGR